MPENYIIRQSMPDVAVVGEDVVDVQRTTVVALPSGVEFVVRVGSASNVATGTHSLASAIADAFNAASGVAGIVGMQQTQDVTALGQLVDVVLIYIESQSGNVVIQKTVPMSTFGTSSLGLSSFGTLSSFATSPTRTTEALPRETTATGTRATFSLDAFSARAASWQAEADALEAA